MSRLQRPGVTFVNVALPSADAGLGASAAGMQWTIDAYAPALASLLLAAGTLGDSYGHRRLMLAGLALLGAVRAGRRGHGGLPVSTHWR